MSSNGSSDARKIRAGLKHPIIDADGHWLEFAPIISEQLKKHGGQRAVDGFFAFNHYVTRALKETPAERKRTHRAQEAFWAVPTRNTLDRATELMPRLLYERLDEFGIDFTVLYPTSGLGVAFHQDEETRRTTCRAFNNFVAEYFHEFADRMTPAAVISMHTPEEAIEELEHVVKTLGLKVVMMASLMRRPVPAYAEKGSVPHHALWLDMLGLDSEYNYDPVWAKCVELGISPTFHSGSRGVGLRLSPTNFVYNHIGHFAAASEAVCKAMFLGGVTRRFPALKMGFLEGGVGWACGLYADLIGHWKKRNRAALEEVNPANLDRALLIKLIDKYGGSWLSADVKDLDAALAAEHSAGGTGGIDDLDDYSACGIKRPEDIRDLFVNNFYFGCEADDPTNAYAFNRKANPYRAQLKVLFGSDIGHFDVPDMKEVVPEAYELVEDELITADDFRDFMFTNPVKFWGEANPRFFDSTRVAKEASAALAESKAALAEARR